MWRKSSKSNTGGNCVEVRGDLTALRDSKAPHSQPLTVPVPDLVAMIRTGRLDR